MKSSVTGAAARTINVAQTLMDWQNDGVNLIISTSQESLENLWRLFGNMGGEWLLHTPLLVISPAMATRAEQFGFRSIIVASGASDEAICTALGASPHISPPSVPPQ